MSGNDLLKVAVAAAVMYGFGLLSSGPSAYAQQAAAHGMAGNADVRQILQRLKKVEDDNANRQACEAQGKLYQPHGDHADAHGCVGLGGQSCTPQNLSMNTVSAVPARCGAHTQVVLETRTLSCPAAEDGELVTCFPITPRGDFHGPTIKGWAYCHDGGLSQAGLAMGSPLLNGRDGRNPCR